eukprot:gene7198-306_t
MGPSTSGNDAQGKEAVEELCIQVPSRFSLSLSGGPCRGQGYAPKGFFFSIGRTRASKIHIKDSSVSEKHAEIFWNGSSWALRDLGSSNGTQINGRMLQPLVELVVLKQGDSILFGTDSIASVQMEAQMLADISIEQLMQAQYETFAQKLEETA